MDLGPVRSVHRAGVLALLQLIVFAALCFAVVVLAITMPFGHPATTGAWKRWLGGLVFGGGGAILLGYAAWISRTTFELCEGGLRQRRAAAIEIAWDEISRVEWLRINGRLRTIVVYAPGRRVAMSRTVRGFDLLAEAVRAHAPGAPPVVPVARARRA